MLNTPTIYLKLERKEDTQYFCNALADAYNTDEEFEFGSFSHRFLSSEESPQWAVAEFTPYTKDVQPRYRFATSKDALDKALIYLDKLGLKATHFDLEKLIDDIKK